MGAAFNSLDALKRWFVNNGRGDTPAPYWNLYVGDFGANEKLVQFNDRVTDVEESFTMLARTITDMNNPGGARFRVAQGVKPRDNAPVGNAYVQIFQNQNQQATPNLPAPAGIAGVPEGYVSKSEIKEALKEAREKWEMEARIQGLEDQLKQPVDWTDRITGMLEKIAESPIGAVLMAKLAGVDMSAIPAAQPAVAGSPRADTDDNPSDEDQLWSDIDVLTEKTGYNENELMRKLRRFVENDPALAKNLLNQIQ